MRNRFPQALAVLAVALSPLAADAALSRAGDASIEFVAVGPAGLKIKGTTHDLTVVDQGADVTVKVPLGGLKTGISLRDNHMREKYLQVEKFPNAELTVPRASIKMPSGGSVSADGQGTLSLHGQKKPVSFHYDAKKNGSVIHVIGTVHLNMNAFGIEVPSYAGVTVKPDVDVNVEFDAKDG
jgi:polyisoprenoid-binding protein YceI